MHLYRRLVRSVQTTYHAVGHTSVVFCKQVYNISCAATLLQASCPSRLAGGDATHRFLICSPYCPLGNKQLAGIIHTKAPYATLTMKLALSGLDSLQKNKTGLALCCNREPLCETADREACC